MADPLENVATHKKRCDVHRGTRLNESVIPGLTLVTHGGPNRMVSDASLGPSMFQSFQQTKRAGTCAVQQPNPQGRAKTAHSKRPKLGH